jgi:hypothetical protein
MILCLSPPVPDRKPTSTKKLNAASKSRGRDRTQPPAEYLDVVAVVTGQVREFGSSQIASEEGKDKLGLLKPGSGFKKGPVLAARLHG